MGLKCELYNDSMQGWKCYPILYQGDNVYEQMTLEEFLGGANEKEQGVMQEM